MRRLTLTLDAPLDAALRDHALREACPLSAVVCRALELRLAKYGRPAVTARPAQHRRPVRRDLGRVRGSLGGRARVRAPSLTRTPERVMPHDNTG